VTRFYFSLDGSLDAGDLLLDGNRVVPDLPAGMSSAGSASVLIPGGIAGGVFYIIAETDGDDMVSETLETNNTKSRAILIGPDLTISNLIVSAVSVPAGGAVNVTDTVTNQGAGVAPPSMTLFYLSKNGALDAADIALTPGRSVPEIAAGAANAGTTPVVIPLTTTPGSYYVLAKADGDGLIGESQETNNVSSRGITVTIAR
jgi:subtilase family serine protease